MRKTLIIFMCAVLSSVPAFALDLEPDPNAYLDEGAPETSPHFHHYVYSVTCLPNQNIYKIEPSGGAYQPKEWRTEVFEKLQKHRPKLPYGIIFNDKVLFQNKLFHVCVLKNNITIQTTIDYEGETSFFKGIAAKDLLPFESRISVTSGAGFFYQLGLLMGGNRKPWQTVKSVSIADDILLEQKRYKNGNQFFESKHEVNLNQSAY